MTTPWTANNQTASSSTDAAATAGDGKVKERSDHQTNNDDNEARYSVNVKKEYIRDERPTSLGSVPPPSSSMHDESNDSKNSSDTSAAVATIRNNKKPNKARNRKRVRAVKIDDTKKICSHILHGEICPYNVKCRFSHDMKEYMANRMPDICVKASGDGGVGGVGGVGDDNSAIVSVCPNYELYGYCYYGAMCRWGSCHVNMATGQNLRKYPEATHKHDMVTQNLLPADLQIMLRKKKFPFKCQRYNNNNNNSKKKRKNKSNSSESKEITNSSSSSSSCPAAAAAAAGLPAPVVGASTETADQSSSSKEIPFKNTTSERPINFSPLPSATVKLVDFSNKVYVAPLTTVGNLPFRRIMKRFGTDITCGEMAVATNLLEGRASEWALLKRHPDEDIFGIQLAAGYADVYTRISEVIEYSQMKVDFVDLNLGCPLDLVCNKGCGATLMMREKRLKESLAGLTKTLSCSVTIKMRTGWDMAKPFAHELVPKIQSWGFQDRISAIMVHGRSRLQRYQKDANWDYIRQVANSQDPSLPRIPLIGNGDIFSYTDYQEKIEREGVSSCAMLGRGALIKPWLPTEIKESRHWDISASERLDILKDFVKFGLEHWGTDQQGVNNCRRFLLEWLSFLYRYVPVGLLEVLPQQMNQRPPNHMIGRSDLETLFLSSDSGDWIKISEMLLGPIPENFRFEPKHKAKGYK